MSTENVSGPPCTAGLLLLGGVYYTLKDAADRGRLGASTFKVLNLAVLVVSLVQAYFYLQMGVGGVQVRAGAVITV